MVWANHAQQFGRHVEARQIARNVGGAARNEAFSLPVQYRDRGFGGDTADMPPQKLVQHYIAQDDDAAAGGLAEQFSHSGNG